MKKRITKICLTCFSNILVLLSVFTVNSACFLGLGQEKEPESLKRLKKI